MNNEFILLTTFHKSNMIPVEKVDADRLQDAILAVYLEKVYIKGAPHAFGVPSRRVRVALDDVYPSI